MNNILDKKKKINNNNKIKTTLDHSINISTKFVKLKTFSLGYTSGFLKY